MASKFYVSMRLYFQLLMLCLFILSCTERKQEHSLNWTYTIPDHGTNSTPRFADLNEDGILDAVIGAGKNEHEIAPYGIMALNGKDGTLLWNYESIDQIVGSATFLDINNDGVSDVIIGGRTSQLMALNGKDGELIWKYSAIDNHPKRRKAKYNFYNTQAIRDIDGDSVGDILATNGGNVWAPPKSEIGREAGTIMLVSGRSGNIIALDTMPDGKETYFSPIIIDQLGDKKDVVIYGSGGETISGNLFMTTLDDILNEDISESKVLLSDKDHGFIAPVVISDINNDGVPDILGNSHGGTIFSIDGNTLDIMWIQHTDNSESSNMVVPGHFRSMVQKDVFAFISLGIFPHNKGTVQVLLDGVDGSIVSSDTLGCFSFASPILIQADDDSFDEVMFSINSYNQCGMIFRENVTDLMLADFSQPFTMTSFDTHAGKNLSVTPSIVDLNHDGSPELIQVVMDNFSTIYLFHGMKIICTTTDLPKDQPKWNTYMGPNYDCILQ